MEPWIVAQCRRACRHQVMAWLVLLAAGLAFLGFQARYLRNFIAGPYAMDEAALTAVTDPATAPRYFVKVTPSQVLDTGVEETTTETENGTPTSTSVSAEFWAAQMGHHLLIVRSKTKPGAKITGQLEPMPSYVADNLFYSGPDGAALRQASYPILLDTQGFRKNGYIMLAVAAVFLWLMYLFVRPALRYAGDPWQHPAIARVAKWGDVQLISAEVERDLKEAARFRAQGVTLADHYAVTNTFFRLNVLRMRDLLWAYEKVTKKRVNFIPAGKEYDAVLKFYGGEISLRAKKESVEKMLQWAAARAPWAVFGYSDQLNTLFTKQTAEFTRAVEARREETAAKA